MLDTSVRLDKANHKVCYIFYISMLFPGKGVGILFSELLIMGPKKGH